MSGYRRAMAMHRWLWLLCGPVVYDHVVWPMHEASQERRRQRRAAA